MSDMSISSIVSNYGKPSTGVDEDDYIDEVYEEAEDEGVDCTKNEVKDEIISQYGEFQQDKTDKTTQQKTSTTSNSSWSA